MTKAHGLLLVLAALSPSTAHAQRFGLSVGYSRMTGQIGHLDSNEGLGLRAGAELNPGSTVRFGLELGIDRLNEARGFSSHPTCSQPSGGPVPCYITARDRDIGWSLAATTRIGPKQGQVRPYLLIGLGALVVRTRSRVRVIAQTGTPLTHLDFDGTSSHTYPVAPLGAGVLFRPAGSPIGIGLEARMTPILHGYDGAPGIAWNPTLMLTVRW